MRSQEPPTLLRDAAYHELRRRIVTLELLPGAAITESELAELLGVTRSAIHGAIQRLRVERLLQVLPRGQTFIAPIDLTEVRHAYDVRTQLEMLAASLCAERATLDEIEAMRQEMDVAKQAMDRVDPVRVVEHVRAFFRLMAAASGNEILAYEHGLVLALTERFEHVRVRFEAEHAVMQSGPMWEVLDAICLRDAEAAGEILHRKVRRERHDYIRQAIEFHFDDPLFPKPGSDAGTPQVFFPKVV